MTAEEIRRMEERVAQVRAEMERACRAAGRAPGEVLLCAASKTQKYGFFHCLSAGFSGGEVRCR